MSAEAFADTSPLTRAERALLEMRPDRPAWTHDIARCVDCGAGSAALSLDWSTIRETVLTALAHGHAVTIHRHPTEWNVGLTIHPRAGQCDCAPAETCE